MTSFAFNTPVLFLIFNRLDTTKNVFEKIRLCKPSQLFIACDGPRFDKNDECEKVDEVRKYVLENVDWSCEVKTLFREENLGCGHAVSEAITWFFNHVEKGIILEDDCLPDLSFFSFCEEMLNHYADDKNVFEVCGSALLGNTVIGNGSYYFSHYGNIWGWATWARAWKEYRLKLTSADIETTLKGIDEVFHDKVQQKYWKHILANINKIDTWDYQWIFTIWRNKGICVVPNSNLVINIGFSNLGTHTTNEPLWYKNAAVNRSAIMKIEHPIIKEVSIEADNIRFYNTIFVKQNLLRRVINKIKKSLTKA